MTLNNCRSKGDPRTIMLPFGGDQNRANHATLPDPNLESTNEFPCVQKSRI